MKWGGGLSSFFFSFSFLLAFCLYGRRFEGLEKGERGWGATPLLSGEREAGQNSCSTHWAISQAFLFPFGGMKGFGKYGGNANEPWNLSRSLWKSFLFFLTACKQIQLSKSGEFRAAVDGRCCGRCFRVLSVSDCLLWSLFRAPAAFKNSQRGVWFVQRSACCSPEELSHFLVAQSEALRISLETQGERSGFFSEKSQSFSGGRTENRNRSPRCEASS